jgi:ATP-dependent helicase/nuclease subunit B
MAGWYSIPAGAGFAETLAKHLLRQWGEQLSSVLVLVPNRRSALNLRQAFLQASEGKALLLPKMIALGDLEAREILRYGNPDAAMIHQLQSLPPAMDAAQRHFTLAQLVRAYYQKRDKILRFDLAFALARDLATLIDELHREEISAEAFEALVPEEYAAQWQEVLAFLQIIREYWPQHLREAGQEDGWQRRVALLKILATCWQNRPPAMPLVIAGTTGSVPAVAALIATAMQTENASLYLPALDTQLSEATIAAMELNHPQAGMISLLKTLQRLPQDFEVLATENPARNFWLQQAFLPLSQTHLWREAAEKTNQTEISSALQGCYYLPCADSHQEAKIITLLLRETLETPAKTAVLVTADRQLARQVRIQMQRFGVMLDDSAGVPLHLTASGNFRMLLVQAVQERFSAISLLSLLKHPLCRLGREPQQIRRITRQIEMLELRGLKTTGLLPLFSRLSANVTTSPLPPAGGVGGGCYTSSAHPHPSPPPQAGEGGGGNSQYNEAKALLAEMITLTEPLQAMAAEAEGLTTDQHFSLREILQRVQVAAEAFSTNAEGKVLLWQTEEGKALAALWQSLDTPVTAEISLVFSDAVLLLRELMAGEVARSTWQRHPRLQILSPMEARMLQADRVILGGLNEGLWPHHAQAEAWLNRSMRKALGLPLPEEQTGLQAHDFYHLAAMPEVFLTRAVKSGGAKTIPSRFLQRMQAWLEGVGGAEAVQQWQQHPVSQWVQAEEAHMQSARNHQPPAPTPPIEARPLRYSATMLETLRKNPSAVYARHVLHLKKLEAIGAEPDSRDFGNAVHRALELFAQAEGWKGQDALAMLRHKGSEVFLPYFEYAPMLEKLWWPRFESIADWVLKQRWPEKLAAELNAEWWVEGIKITAKIDRLESSAEGYAVVDYKTGSPPSIKEILSGYALQITLAAVMAEMGCLGQEYAHATPQELAYWALKGGREGGAIRSLNTAQIAQAMERLKQLIPALMREYQNPATAFAATPDRRKKLRYNDYAHLERTAEWGGF